MINYHTTAETSRLIKKILKEAFPTVLFSVKGIDVRWTDGPNTNEVDKFVNLFAAGDFNSSLDMYEYASSKHAYAGKLVKKLRFVFTTRNITKKLSEEGLAKFNSENDCFGIQERQDYAHHFSKVITLPSPTFLAIENAPVDDLDAFLSNQVARQLAEKEKQELTALLSNTTATKKPTRI